MPNPLFPFSDAQQFSTSLRTPYIGGEVIPVLGGPSNVNLPISHGLHRTPRFHQVWEISNNREFATPRPRGTTPWDDRAIYLNWPSTGAPCLIFVA